MKQNYSAKIEQGMAKALGKDLPISMKVSSEVCRFIRGRSVDRARKILMDCIDVKKAIPYTRYNHSVAHKTKIGPGRFPVKTCENIIGIIDSAVANAQFKGINTSNLFVYHICVQKSSQAWHPGRKRRRQMKRSHIEVVLKEMESKKKEEKKNAKVNA
jgi:large subunit ribosomal protein L22